MHISIIDDEQILATKIGKKLRNSGYCVSVFTSYWEFIRNGDMSSQLYIIDISLRDGSGFDIVKQLRKDGKSKVPIIIISGYGDSQNIIYGLDLGADDYLRKPFVPDELIARVRAVLRRPETISKQPVLKYMDITLDLNTREVHVWDEKIFFTKNENSVLECLLANRGQMISREKLIAQVWGWHRYAEVSDNTVNATLSKIRKKLGGRLVLKTVYNQGYILE